MRNTSVQNALMFNWTVVATSGRFILTCTSPCRVPSSLLSRLLCCAGATAVTPGQLPSSCPACPDSAQ